jgi:amino acid permease
VFKSSADTGYFLPIFAKANKHGVPIISMLILLAAFGSGTALPRSRPWSNCPRLTAR